MLSGELAGPVYLVSHGRNVLPSPVVVLQDGGVTLELPGSTTIDKAGIGSVTFNSTPDVPLGSLELFLPAGPHSLLGANTSLCTPGKAVTVKRSITQRVRGRTVPRTVKVREHLPASVPMGTELVAHNGAVIHETTKITVTGCAAGKAKTARRSQATVRIRRIPLVRPRHSYRASRSLRTQEMSYRRRIPRLSMQRFFAHEARRASSLVPW